MQPFNPQKERDIINYNFLVDDILHISPPYHTDNSYGQLYPTVEGGTVNQTTDFQGASRPMQ